MNRAARRRLEKDRQGSSLQPGYRLKGGPMAGWYVTEDAPALLSSWWRSWPDSIRAEWSPGRYLPAGKEGRVRVAEWRPYTLGGANA